MKKVIFSLLIAVLVVVGMVVPFVPEAKAGEEYVVTFFFADAPSDGGWNKAHDVGVRELQSLGVKIEEWDQGFVVELPAGSKYQSIRVHLVTNVGYGDSIESIMRAALESQHPDMVFGTWWDSKDAIATLAQEYSDVLFNHCSGYPVLKSTDPMFEKTQNVSTYFPRMYHADYQAGKAVGMLGFTKIGGVATYPIPEPVRGFNAFIAGVRAGREEAGLPETDLEFRLVWLFSWLNPENEGLAADALVAEGYEIIRQGADTATASERACAATPPVPAVGYGTAPTDAPCFIIANEWKWGTYYIRQVLRGIDGEWSPEDWYEEGTKIVFNESLDVVSQEVRDAVMATPLEEVWSKDFYGYGHDPDGKEYQAFITGGTMTDEILLSMQVLDREIVTGELIKSPLPQGVWIKYESTE